MVRGGRPADFPAAGLGDGQMLECNGNLDGVDVVVASCIYTSNRKESYTSDLTFELRVNNTLVICNNHGVKVLARKVSSCPMDAHFWKKCKENSINHS